MEKTKRVKRHWETGKWGEQEQIWVAPPGKDEEGKGTLGNRLKWGKQQEKTWGAPLEKSRRIKGHWETGGNGGEMGRAAGDMGSTTWSR